MHRLWLTVVIALCVPPVCGSVIAQEAKPVVLAKVIEVEVKSGQRVVGTVHPLRSSVIGSALDGRVKEFLVDQGDRVEQGDVLATLRTETLEIELAAAEAELDLATERKTELENGARPEEIAEAEANMKSAQAALKNAEDNWKRIQALSVRAAASPAELGDAKEQADAAKFAFRASEALLKRIKDGPRVETIAQAKAQVELQRQRLNLINDRIAKSAIRAPFDGWIAAEFTEVGSWITQGDPIAQVIQLDEVEVLAPVTAGAVVNLRKGDVIRVEFPDLPNELLTGTIDRIVPMATSRARTFPVHIKLKNEVRDGSPMLMAGMLARVDLPAGEREVLPLVPKDALVLNGNDRSVFVIRASAETTQENNIHTARKVPVDLGVAYEDRIQVRGDIRSDDLVVVFGNERLTHNARVRVVREPGTTKQTSIE